MTKTKNCVTLYLSKHIAFDRVLSQKFKMMASPDLFFIFSKFWFSEFLGQKGQNMTQNDKKNCLPPYFRNCTTYDCDFWYTCAKWWYLQHFFIIFSPNDSPLKTIKNVLFHLKSSFRSQDIQCFFIFSLPFPTF